MDNESREEFIREDRLRLTTIAALGNDFNIPQKVVNKYMRNRSVEDFKREVLEGVPKRVMTRDLDLPEKDLRGYSIARAIKSMADHGDFRDAGLEGEVSHATQQLFKKEPRDKSIISIPPDVKRHPIGSRDLNVGIDSQGGYLVATDVLSMIDMLRIQSKVRQMGARVLEGLVGNVAIPKQSAGASAYWIGEGQAPTESQPTIGQIAMTPKTVGAYTEFTRKLMLQSSQSVEAMIRRDLTALIATEIDRVSINGTGVGNEPLGIRNTTGIGSVIAGDPDGAAPTWEDIIDLESEISVDNADQGALGYLTNSKVRGKLKKTLKAAGIAGYIWEGPTNLRDTREGMGLLNGNPAGVSNNVPSNLSKGASNGILSSIIFGNWSELLIGEWGSLDLMVNPFTNRKNGIIEVTVFQDVDLLIRHPESFAVMDDVLTT